MIPANWFTVTIRRVIDRVTPENGVYLHRGPVEWQHCMIDSEHCWCDPLLVDWNTIQAYTTRELQILLDGHYSVQ